MTLQRQPCTSERGPKRVVLLVEDEPFVREETCYVLQSAGFDVVPTADGLETMKASDHGERNINLLMSDIALPGRSGQHLAEDMRGPSAEFPILLTSGYM